jgi:23S rRNA (adenine2503-C2)-methyltransferase
LKSVLGHTPDELRAAFAAAGIEPFRADQVLCWVYQRGVRDFERMSNLALPLRTQLGAAWETGVLEVADVLTSADGTRKLLLATDDGARIESVIIPEGSRRTVCVSSQAGCSLDCPFCATGRMGPGRNLRSEEITDQVLLAAGMLGALGERPTHVVFMGMGEPLLNFASVVRAIRVLCDPRALGMSPRRITVSTAGVVPRMVALGEAVPVRLAVSLHATTDPVRDELVPLNRRFPIGAVLEACRSYPLRPRDRISFEYALIAGVNDDSEDASRLARLLRGIPSKVNVIPLNPHGGSSYARPTDDVVDRFADRLARSHVSVTVRRSRGTDILAACGQLGAGAPAVAPERLKAPELPSDNALR